MANTTAATRLPLDLNWGYGGEHVMVRQVDAISRTMEEHVPDPRDYSQSGFCNAVRQHFGCECLQLQLVSLVMLTSKSRYGSLEDYDLMACDWQAVLNLLNTPGRHGCEGRYVVIEIDLDPSCEEKSMDDTPEPEKASRWVTRSSVRGRRGPKTAVLKSTSQDATTIRLTEAVNPVLKLHGAVAETGPDGREDAYVVSVIDGDAMSSQVTDKITSSSDVAKSAEVDVDTEVGQDDEEGDLELQLKEVQIKRQLLRLKKRKREESGVGK
ncbi:hypothetical protein LTR15_003166 [Elasticomyces elasticus]|nr:hypothetical protein LTR15_003166 [Elasticomyces elasticus]